MQEEQLLGNSDFLINPDVCRGDSVSRPCPKLRNQRASHRLAPTDSCFRGFIILCEPSWDLRAAVVKNYMTQANFASGAVCDSQLYLRLTQSLM